MNKMIYLKNRLDNFLVGGGGKEIKEMGRKELVLFLQNELSNLSYDNDQYIEWLKRQGELESKTFKEKENSLYPNFADPCFNAKLAKKKRI